LADGRTPQGHHGRPDCLSMTSTSFDAVAAYEHPAEPDQAPVPA
jgi:hypothetical protein